jgi:hypothetical protein
MPKCQYCGQYESSKWNLAGFTCSDCRLNCPHCGNDSKIAGWNYFVVHGDHALTWCYDCGHLLPPELDELDNPVTDDDVQAVLDAYDVDFASMTWRDVDSVPDDVDSVSSDDVETYWERELPDGVTVGGVANV